MRVIITDPRIVRYSRKGQKHHWRFVGTADLKIVDVTFYTDPNPSFIIS